MTNASRIPQTHRLILVRHAHSSVDPARPAREWGLADDGRAAARRLASLAVFDHAAGFYAGPEPKMLATLAPVAAEHGQQVQPEPGFAETHSEGWLGGEQFLSTVHRFFETPDQPPAPDWETAAAAAARFAAAVERLRARHAPVVHPGHALPATFAIASGGRMLTAYLSHLLGYSAERALEAWHRLKMPDIAVVELAATAPPRVVILFGTLAV
ncbi:MAG: histidine phosphatase family protein [Chloroflexi bacterium]|nr:histidine phosphatase family protein [Chloroflexota bacterium]